MLWWQSIHPKKRGALAKTMKTKYSPSSNGGKAYARVPLTVNDHDTLSSKASTRGEANDYPKKVSARGTNDGQVSSLQTSIVA